MSFMNLFGPGSPLNLMNTGGGPLSGDPTAGGAGMPAFGTPQYYAAMATGAGLPNSFPQGQGPIGPGVGLTQSPAFNMPYPGPNPALSFSPDPMFASGQLQAPWNGTGNNGTAAASNTAAPTAVSTQSISDLIKSLLGPAPTIDSLFSSTPYENTIAKLASNKTGAAQGISDSYTKALADLATVTAQAKQDQAGYANTASANAAQATSAQQGFNQGIGNVANSNSAMGALMQGQAARMATDQANQAQTTNRLASVQSNDLSHSAQDAALGQMGALNALNTATASAQAKVGTQEATDRSTAMKELAAMLSARTGQYGNLMNNAESFVSKNSPSTNSRDQVNAQLAQLQEAGSPIPKVVNSIVHGIPGVAYGAASESDALRILTEQQGSLPPGVDPNQIKSMLHDYYQNRSVSAPTADINAALASYLKGLVGANG